MALQVTVDRKKCCGYGICVEVCPDLFTLDHQGFALVVGDGTVTGDLEAKAAEAVASCPELAISMDEG